MSMSILVNCMVMKVMKGNLTPVKRGMLQCKLRGFGDSRCFNSSMLHAVCPVLSKVKGHIKDGTRRKRLPGPENFCWVYDVRNKGGKRKRKYIEVIGRPAEASKKVDGKKRSLFALICLLCVVLFFLLFNVSQ